MKRRIVRGLNYFNVREASLICGSDHGPTYIPCSLNKSDYRTVKAYLFNHGGK